MAFTKATKAKQKLRLAIDGVSGSGKTFTALSIASGLSEKIAVIDSEHGSSELYADRFSFDVMKLQKFQIEDYTGALYEAAANGYQVCIIDSTSHAWDALVERVERIASQKYSGNTFRAWGEGTPLQRKLIEAMLSYPGHLIVTCRSKTEYSVDKDEKSGRTTVRKVGTAAVQRQGFEYEFTMAMTMDANHVGLVTKDRTGKFQDMFIEKPGKELGEQLLDWLNTGADIIPQEEAKAENEAPTTHPQNPPANVQTPPASASAAPTAHPSTPTTGKRAPEASHTTTSADELVKVLAACYEGTNEPIFEEEYKNTLRAEIMGDKQLYGPKVAYDTALQKAKVEIVSRIAKRKAASIVPPVQPDIF